MIPNSLTKTGAYAGLWSYLKSVDCALARSLDEKTSPKLTEFDKERINSFADFLEDGISINKQESFTPSHLLQYMEKHEPNYSSSLNLRSLISEVEEFDSFQKMQRVGFDKKLQKLIESIRSSLNPSEKDLFIYSTYHEEFTLLRLIVQNLLRHAEVSLTE
ncbi:MAG: hypothetical protein PHR77_06015 [Kiritimatiellae bacterium]|nr:hypothetical protein [Kiritimatiellia bacterium]MDD5522473.1 hypothetical protein [Kiritimatiellia bacterium]